jgi:predicted aldo/keto reductase-like oxidoreductase
MKDEGRMKKITLGKTGLNITRLGFGGIPIQRVSEDLAVETVRHAVKCGVDFIDTAKAYTTSETRIGIALKDFDQKIVLATKSASRDPSELRQDLENSLANLQRDYIDLYQLHYVKNEEEYQQIISPGGALEVLIKAKAEKLIGHIGITSHSLDLADRILDDDIFESILVCFSFLENQWVKENIEKARRCSACEECMPRCPYDLSIPDLIRENIEWLDEKQP